MKLRDNPSLPDNKKDSIKILATKINLVNAVDYNQFSNSIQFDVEELETYARAMQGPYIAKWA